MYDIIILGSGPAGFTAGIYSIRAGRKTLLVAGSRWGGQLMLTTLVENFPGFPEGIQGPQLMMNMRKQVERLGVEVLNSEFTQADFTRRPFQMTVNGKIYESKSVIISTGADSVWLGVPGEAQLRGKGVSTCATCDAFFFRGKDVVIVGGGDSAMEEALVLSKVAKSVTIVHRREQFKASKAMQDRVFADPKIKIVWNAELVKYNGTNNLESVNLKCKMQNSKLQFKIQNEDLAVSFQQFNNKTMKQWGGQIIEQKDDEIIWQMPVDGVFIAIGHKPNSDRFKGLEVDAKGYITRKEIKEENGLLKYRSATSVPGVFVAGDVNDYRYKQAITSAGFGAMAALDADRWLQENG